jgi:hypothetical protein
MWQLELARAACSAMQHVMIMDCSAARFVLARLIDWPYGHVTFRDLALGMLAGGRWCGGPCGVVDDTARHFTRSQYSQSWLFLFRMACPRAHYKLYMLYTNQEPCTHHRYTYNVSRKEDNAAIQPYNSHTIYTIPRSPIAASPQAPVC